MNCAIAVALLLCTEPAAETTLQVNGISFHDHSGYNGINWGMGLEKPISPNVSASVGWYNNSLDRISLYGTLRYSFYKNSDWDLGVRGGVITGYKISPAPVFVPEVCYKYVCSIFIPSIKFNNSNVIGINLRIPIKDLTK